MRFQFLQDLGLANANSHVPENGHTFSLPLTFLYYCFCMVIPKLEVSNGF
ncbi:hypothetical protein J2S36_001273 [Arcanobacterium hippocoleae]|uniref:Uncharacterized protein n=1 Tax=Arcanobacterium hippocoleae TaxID=149017 RepID=A0ABU1T2W7_9ACTO|nr:hypothetical protein [Arcanobacterium hippocoleae]